jgi:hypothetical protein
MQRGRIGGERATCGVEGKPKWVGRWRTEEVERKTGSSMLLGSDDVVVDGEEDK